MVFGAQFQGEKDSPNLYYLFRYVKAENSFHQAIQLVEKCGLSLMPEKWATLLHNMGRTLAKLEKYEDALEFHKHVCVLCIFVAY